MARLSATGLLTGGASHLFPSPTRLCIQCHTSDLSSHTLRCYVIRCIACHRPTWIQQRWRCRSGQGEGVPGMAWHCELTDAHLRRGRRQQRHIRQSASKLLEACHAWRVLCMRLSMACNARCPGLALIRSTCVDVQLQAELLAGDAGICARGTSVTHLLSALQVSNRTQCVEHWVIPWWLRFCNRPL